MFAERYPVRGVGDGCLGTVEGLYCKRPIQCLASSEILTPHPLTPWRVWAERGWGINSSEDARHCSALSFWFKKQVFFLAKIVFFFMLNFSYSMDSTVCSLRLITDLLLSLTAHDFCFLCYDDDGVLFPCDSVQECGEPSFQPGRRGGATGAHRHRRHHNSLGSESEFLNF
jgi:hypothetical protein